MTARTTPSLDADLVAGLKRLKLAAVRRIAPEVLLTAKTQRWTPEETLRTLVEAEIAARDASNTKTRLRTAGFPVTKTLDEFNVSVSSSPNQPSTTWRRWSGSPRRRTCVSSDQPAPANPTCSSP
jgi:DNA replication protein DnaC